MPSVLRSDEEGLATLTLNRPDKLNALDEAMFYELDAHLAAIEREGDTVGAVLVRSEGKAFCAGIDLADATSGKQVITPLEQSRIVNRLASLPQPVIAAVHGVCYTGGLEVALAADLIVAAESARFADTHGKWGLTAAWGMTQRLPRRIGRSQALRMMFTSLAVPAPEALTLGLIDLCVPELAFKVEIGKLTAAILANSWFTNRANKQLMNATDGLPLAVGLAHEFYHRAGRAPDFAERVAAFKR